MKSHHAMPVRKLHAALHEAADVNAKALARYHAQRMEVSQFDMGYLYGDGSLPGVFFYKFLASATESVNMTAIAPMVEHLRCWVPDTIVFSGSYPPVWIYSDAQGLVRKVCLPWVMCTHIYKDHDPSSICPMKKYDNNDIRMWQEIWFSGAQVLAKLERSRVDQTSPIALMKTPVIVKEGAKAFSMEGNHVKLFMNTMELGSALDSAMNHHSSTSSTDSDLAASTFALQQFIKPKGPQAFIVRAIYRYGKAPHGWMISSTRSFENSADLDHLSKHQQQPQSQTQPPQSRRDQQPFHASSDKRRRETTSADEMDNLHRFCTMTALDEGCSFVKLGARACRDVYNVHGQVVQYVEQHAFHATLESFVGDYIKDEHGQWWLLQIKCFRLRGTQIHRPTFLSPKIAYDYARSMVLPTTAESTFLPPAPGPHETPSSWTSHGKHSRRAKIPYDASRSVDGSSHKSMHEHNKKTEIGSLATISTEARSAKIPQLHKMVTCKCCHVLYTPQKLAYKLTLKMIHDMISSVQARCSGTTSKHDDEDVYDSSSGRAVSLQLLFTQHRATDLRKEACFHLDRRMRYHSYSVCHLCYALYERDQSLRHVEAKFSRSIGCPVKRSTNVNACLTFLTEDAPLSASSLSQPRPMLSLTSKWNQALPSQLTLCRLALFFTELHDIPSELFDNERPQLQQPQQHHGQTGSKFSTTPSQLYLRFSVLGFDCVVPLDIDKRKNAHSVSSSSSSVTTATTSTAPKENHLQSAEYPIKPTTTNEPSPPTPPHHSLPSHPDGNKKTILTQTSCGAAPAIVNDRENDPVRVPPNGTTSQPTPNDRDSGHDVQTRYWLPLNIMRTFHFFAPETPLDMKLTPYTSPSTHDEGVPSGLQSYLATASSIQVDLIRYPGDRPTLVHAKLPRQGRERYANDPISDIGQGTDVDERAKDEDKDQDKDDQDEDEEGEGQEEHLECLQRYRPRPLQQVTVAHESMQEHNHSHQSQSSSSLSSSSSSFSFDHALANTRQPQRHTLLGSVHLSMSQFQSPFAMKTDIYQSMSPHGDLYHVRGSLGSQRLRVVATQDLLHQTTLRPYHGVFVPDRDYVTIDPLCDEWLDALPCHETTSTATAPRMAPQPPPPHHVQAMLQPPSNRASRTIIMSPCHDRDMNSRPDEMQDKARRANEGPMIDRPHDNGGKDVQDDHDMSDKEMIMKTQNGHDARTMRASMNVSVEYHDRDESQGHTSLYPTAFYEHDQCHHNAMTKHADNSLLSPPHSPRHYHHHRNQNRSIHRNLETQVAHANEHKDDEDALDNDEKENWPIWCITVMLHRTYGWKHPEGARDGWEAHYSLLGQVDCTCVIPRDI